MRSFLWISAFALLIGCSASKTSQTWKVGDTTMNAPLDAYLQGHATGQNAEFAKAFDAKVGMLYWQAPDGKYNTRTATEYINGASGKPPADEAQRKRFTEKADMTNEVGIGKIILDYPTAYFVDYMTLMKIGGEWKIVNKIFHVEPKNAPRTNPDATLAKKPIEDYFEANRTGNGNFIRQAFHADAKIFHLKNGQLVSMTSKEFADLYGGAPSFPPEQRIDLIDVTGTSAIARVTLVYPRTIYTDYIALLWNGEKWQIINKTYTERKR